ncbi:type III secretion system inner membrane ring lipoprotein SctJ [Burkholderia oklahomensis]|uniref:Lipoprotein n=2 Tax=Burkholderia oklahomensis TaxID=342113 RepID=A0AAI8BD54_9BURK|nr:type III secretion inner membrane ring lipoprotein SctJ [Burkholderia oklahomensis]AIO69819.1 type III secretion apparatus lipoprotein, YscJ/HrcJ family [Burkholderia oklahomensis]AJX36162.1 type III secretion apparatus lipoprotein, YscJ/HrcJ family [Burkholderia oklahomensis C6786]AOI39208.1 type III secretion protein SsaJ [Burkholderia oklahomensis EO147]AOI48896.1 type III secretion protein SsaJ [Burkholderia oklahomensis C6786]KUY50502.1 type III secretion protein SsaJ [Burkholderia okl
MTARASRVACAAALALSLAACKSDLYTNLPEAEANQMIALLMLRDIAVDKKPLKDGNVTIRVESDQFVNAVELMRQNGLPRRKLAALEDLFPPGQLVTSPAQEQAKITFLKEQQLEKMLRAMDGVVDAQVSIAEAEPQNRRDPPQPSASVFVKYSPERNFGARETEIRSLVVTGTPGLSPDHVSVVLQPADYRYDMPAEDEPAAAPGLLAWLRAHRLALGIALGALGIVASLALAVVASRSRSSGEPRA